MRVRRRIQRVRGRTDTATIYASCMNRVLIVLGVIVVLAGIFWRQLSALPFFRLPGDIVIDRPGMKFFFPLTTMLLISALVSLILWLFRR